MKEKVLIAILVIVLVALIFQLGMKRFHTVSKEDKPEEANIQVIQIMSEMENETAYENYMKSLAESNQDLPLDIDELLKGSLEDVASQTDDKSSMGTDTGVNQASDKLPEYAKLYPDLYVDKICPECIDKEKKVAYLTFDDGPSENTLKILDILQEKGAVATFFVLGCTITKDGEAALKRMPEVGCKIGIHTYSHNRKVIYGSVDGFLHDFNKVYTQIYEITGEHPNIFRFPWGSYNAYSKPIKKKLVAEMNRRGFTYYDWNVSAEDSVGKPTESSIMKNILKDVKKYNQPVILMHDSSVNDLTVKTLPKVIDKLTELGYTFDTLDHREPCQFCY